MDVVHTPQVSCSSSSGSASRRQLFPSLVQENSDDLEESIHPLNDITNDNQSRNSSRKFLKNCLSDYELLEYIHSYQNNHADSYLELLNTSQESDKSSDDYTTCQDTPSRSVPTIAMKTPDDAPMTMASSTVSAPKLIRKSPEASKHKRSPIDSSFQKLDCVSKVRTELFPQSIPVSSFYSNVASKHVETTVKSPTEVWKLNLKALIPKRKQHLPTLCGQKTKGKKHLGKINAGVNHKIKKIKLKRVIAGSVNNSIDVNSRIEDEYTAPLMEYMKEIRELFNMPKQIQEIKKIEEPCRVGVENNHLGSFNKKRKGSPVRDSSNKFFKHRRHDTNIAVNERVKFVIDEGQFNCIADKKTSENTSSELDMFGDDENLIAHEDVESIIFSLTNEEEVDAVKPYSALLKQCQVTNKIVSEDNGMLLSPTTQMCNMTSGLALNSPTRAVRNLNNGVLNKENIENTGNEKLFPVFYNSANPPSKPSKPVKCASLKKLKALPKDQMLLDAGQKKFGVTQCFECNYVYHMGDVNDEIIHQNYHSATNTLRFGGWKDEQVVGYSENARIIRVVPTDPTVWLKKVKNLLEVVNRDLGYFDMDVIIPRDTQIYLYIAQKTIAGCLVAEPKTIGHRMLPDTGVDTCSTIAIPIKCGVNRIWVAELHRNNGIGKALLNCLRSNFLFGSVLSKNDIAFSSPTVAGKAFATKYFNTPNFLIYFT